MKKKLNILLCVNRIKELKPDQKQQYKAKYSKAK